MVSERLRPSPPTLNGAVLASLGSCKSRLAVGSRVLAQFKEPNAQGKRPCVYYYAGVVGEQPVENNHFRSVPQGRAKH